jgi:hypothetical protein
MCNLAPSFARHIGRTDEDGPHALDSCAGGAVVICFSGFRGGCATGGIEAAFAASTQRVLTGCDDIDGMTDQEQVERTDRA